MIFRRDILRRSCLLCSRQLYISRKCHGPTAKNLVLVSHVRRFTPPTIRVSHRTYSSAGRLAVGVVGRLLKLRYLVLTTGIGAGVAAHQKYESFRDSLPELDWFKDYLPDSEFAHNVVDKISHAAGLLAKLPSSIRFPELPSVPVSSDWFRSLQPALNDVKHWLDEMSASDPSIFSESFLEGNYLLNGSVPEAGSSLSLGDQRGGVRSSFLGFGQSGESQQSADKKSDDDAVHTLQTELLEQQIQHQREMEKLEKEVRELKKLLMLREGKSGKARRMKMSLIDMYSEVLDLHSDYDASYNSQEHLPQVVVVGDQSSGKTSVLEMIAQARIFPRGSGEMMTRSPVKVTLSEGPYHIASFRDGNHEYDLTNESELKALRREIEVRMKASVAGDQTVSGETISLTVKGPGLQRMVLVDLPGIISTVTTGMATDTRERIKKICMHHMENPNSIILCIQDGSLDAERSIVTDLVSSVDTTGKRTIFVLTKVDVAENNLYNPERIRQILEGRLFPMKALGYFAVVTGKGNTDDSIKTIKDYEEDFFRRSKLCRDGVLKTSQMTTRNLSTAVSKCFWKMVHESIEQEVVAFKAKRVNLETEWKYSFEKVREMDREELFEKARGEILDEIVNLSLVSPQQWEEAFSEKLWNTVSEHVFENIYLPIAQADNTGTFNTLMDIKLKQWADKELPSRCVQVGLETLRDQFTELQQRSSQQAGHDKVFDKLKDVVRDQSLGQHKWDSKALDSLRVMQVTALDDRAVPSKAQWDQAVKFMEERVKQRLHTTEEKINAMLGPGKYDQWLKWTSRSAEQQNRVATCQEMEKLLLPGKKLQAQLTPDEVTALKKNLEMQNIVVMDNFIKETWQHVYRRHFLRKALAEAKECKKGFFYYQKGFTDNGMDCSDVVLFWRLQNMLNTTSNALRQQVMNNEARRLERNVKDVLDRIGSDRQQLESLLTGKRVLLAEELKRVRRMQELLEEFLTALNKEKP